MDIFTYIILSVIGVSLVSLSGILFLSLQEKKLKSFLIYLVSFSAGALLGDAFIHLLPELFENSGFGLNISLYILGGILVFFILEKILHWQHCHMPLNKEHVHSFGVINLIGDGFHNFIDGAIIAASYLVSIPLGFATTIAVLFHEIPQEIGDFGILLHAGYKKSKAIMFNLLSALTSIIGALVVLVFTDFISGIEMQLIAIAAGGFIYIAGSDLIPELHKNSDKIYRSFLQLLFFVLGIAFMLLLLFLE